VFTDEWEEITKPNRTLKALDGPHKAWQMWHEYIVPRGGIDKSGPKQKEKGEYSIVRKPTKPNTKFDARKSAKR
jgi:hypothetical protein